MGNVHYYVPSVNLVGRGCLGEIGREAVALHVKRAFVVASEGSVGEEQAAVVASVLAQVGVESRNFCKTVPNPTAASVRIGLEAYRGEACDGLVAVGGGSAIDAAKAIGILASNGGDILDYEGTDLSFNAMPPFIAISTTAGTGSEVTRFAVISDADHRKVTICDRHMTPHVSVNDPEMMVSMPPSLTAATGMDAFTHALEACVSTGATPITDGKALAAIELISHHLPRAVHDGRDTEARENMCYASFLAGSAFNNAGLGLVHAMAHPLGGLYDLPHGLCNALLLPSVCEFNLMAAYSKFARVAMCMGVGQSWRSERENAERMLGAISDLSRESGLPRGLQALGVKRDDLPRLAELAMLETIGSTNPRAYSSQDVLSLYENAF